MVGIAEFGLEVIVISASGVLAPGPLFFANMLYGTRQGARAGIKVAFGHTVVELPVMILLVAGLFSSAVATHYAGAIGIVGGIGIMGFAVMQVIGVAKRRSRMQPVAETKKGPFLAGVALTALNPLFLVWWFTVGLKLVSDSAAFGLVAGIFILFALHIWMDYAWLATTAYLASRGSSALKSKYYPLLLLGLAAVLAYYGLTLVLNAVSG